MEHTGKPKPKGPKNMLLKSIGRYLQQSKKEKIQPMGEINTHKMVQNLLEDKLNNDIDAEKKGKKLKILPNYVLDQLSMKFGLKTIAVKNLISLKEGLSQVTKSYRKENPNRVPYSMIMTSIMGLDAEVDIHFDEDQTNLIIKSKPLWGEAQEIFKKNMKVRKKNINDFHLNDLQTGGTCSALDLIDVFTSWCSKDKDLISNFLPKILPEVSNDIKENEAAIKKFYLDFSLMKICQKVAKLGKDIKAFYDIMDDDKSGSLDPQEILAGLRDKFNVYFSQEQAEDLCAYLDEDGSGDVDFEEFQDKISYENFNTNYHLYLITYQRFIELLLEEWKEHKQRTYQKLMQKFVEFDDNGDGVLTFDEFEQLINNLEKKMDRDSISELFNETLEMDERSTDLDKMNPE